MIARFALICAAGLALLTGIEVTRAQDPAQVIETQRDAQSALRSAEAQSREARLRAESFEQRAASAVAAADKTAQESAALAARVQQAEAQIAANEARIGLIGQQRQALRIELAERQKPVVELTAALQRLSRRPALFSLLRPGSLQDAVYLRAVLETMLPEVGRRTAGLRAALERSKQLQAQAEQASADLRASQGELNQRRQQLLTIEARQRLESRSAGSLADREAERALGLAEQARDLSALVGELDKAGRLRAQLAALPGPVLRPAMPQSAAVPPMAEVAQPPANALCLPLAVTGGSSRALAMQGRAGRSHAAYRLLPGPEHRPLHRAQDGWPLPDLIRAMARS